MSDLISLIIPIYNTEKILKNCLNYIFNQSCIYLEIILIKDGSTDKSLSVCNHYIGKR